MSYTRETDAEMRDRVLREAQRICRTVHLFLDRADENSLALFKQCAREAFEETCGQQLPKTEEISKT